MVEAATKGVGKSVQKEAVQAGAKKATASIKELPEHMAEKGLQQADGWLAKSMGYTKDFLSGVGARTAGTSAPTATVWDKITYPIRWLGDQIPVVRPTLGEVFVPGLQIKWAARSMGKFPKWLWHHRYPVLLMLAYLSEAQDSMNEKYQPVGINSFALNMPNLLGPSIPFDLVPEAEGKFIRNKKVPGHRFYLVSPCKAKLTIRDTRCDCTSHPLNDRFNFEKGGYLQDIKKGSITIKQEVLAGTYQGEELSESKLRGIKNFYKNIIQDPDLVMANVKIDDSYFGFGESVREIDSTENLFRYMRPYFDTSKAIKDCNQRDAGMSIVKLQFQHIKDLSGQAYEKIKKLVWDADAKVDWVKYDNVYTHPTYRVDCLEIDVEIKDGYCFDYFPKLEALRTSLAVVAIIAELFLGTASGGTLLFAIGAGAALLDSILGHMEKWP